MERLVPFERLDDDYYLGEHGREGGESEDEMSSDDELQTHLKELAGIPSCKQEIKEKERSEFEDDMENELDISISDYADKHMRQRTDKVEEMETDDGPPPLESVSDDDELEQVLREKEQKKEKIELPPAPAKSALKGSSTSADTSTEAPSPTKKKHVSIKEENKDDIETVEKTEKMEEDNEETEDNPIKKMAKETKKGMKEEPPEFYDEDEDDDNERWVADQRRQNKGDSSGGNDSLNERQQRTKIDDGSDAVLSCPGCMCLLTRDCQRHELYKDQYRAMFVENVNVEDEQMTVEKSGKEKRRQRQKQKKGLEVILSESDVFYPVKCAVCSTSVAVMDRDEVYHFFNVLAGYA